MEDLYSQKGFPHKGWTYECYEDLGDLIGKCQICGHSLRYIHYLSHENWDDVIEVGCQCCEGLVESYSYSKLLANDKQMKKRKTRRNKFMNKPNEFDTTQAGGDFIPVELGGHYAVIKNVSERETKNGDPMIVVSIDFDKKDGQAGYFTEQFKKDVRPDKKYPNQAVNYITTEYGGTCTRGFKSFIKAYADSNNLTEDKIKWGTDFVTQFKNKKIGVVYGNVEELYNGETKLRRKIRWFCDYNKVSNQNVPFDKLLDEKVKPAASVTDKDGFMQIPEVIEDEIPFD